MTQRCRTVTAEAGARRFGLIRRMHLGSGGFSFVERDDLMNRLILGLLASSVVIGGCARHTEAPIASNFPYQQQHKLQSAAHWQLIARDTAAQIKAQLPTQRALYVHTSGQHSPFEQAFMQQLASELASTGYPMMKRAQRPDVLTVEVSATPLRFSRHRQQYSTTGVLTALSSGLWVLHEIYNNVSPGAAMVAGAVAVDATTWLRSEFASGPTPRTELIVNTRVSSADQYYLQTTSAYYTADGDLSLYENWPTAILPVKGE